MFRFEGETMRPERRLEDYPSFQPVRSKGHARGPAFLLAGVLLAATLCAGASLSLVGGAAAGGLQGTEKAPRPFTLEAGCDGAWGNEPLDCLLQTA